MKLSKQDEAKYFALYKKSGDLNHLMPIFKFVDGQLRALLARKYKNVSEISSVDDISQEFYLLIYEKSDRFQSVTSSIRKYLFSMLHNFLNDYWLKNKKVLKNVMFSTISTEFDYGDTLSYENVAENTLYNDIPVKRCYNVKDKIGRNKEYMEKLVVECNKGEFRSLWEEGKREEKKIVRKTAVPNMNKLIKKLDDYDYDKNYYSRNTDKLYFK